MMARRIRRRSRAISARPSQYSARGDAACDTTGPESAKSPMKRAMQTRRCRGSFATIPGRKTRFGSGFEVGDMAIARFRIDRVVGAGAECGREVEGAIGPEQPDQSVVDLHGAIEPPRPAIGVAALPGKSGG